MYRLKISISSPVSSNRFSIQTVSTSAAAGAGILFAGPAYAIPSPELVIGSISSVSQLMALGVAMLGGGAAAAGMRASAKAGRDDRSAKMALRIAAGLFVVVLLSAGLNIYQFVDQRQQGQTRLQATLTRPAVTAGTRILDPNLKVTSFAAQSDHGLGISTADTTALLEQVQTGERSDVVLLDIRETSENEMGTLPGARHIRFPDLAKSNIDLAGKTAILLCHNGNRSSETCEKLARLGIDCRFIVGGIEKWIVEGRSFTDRTVRSLSDLRALPSYPAQNVLLDTPDVRGLIENEQAAIVDVRYPADFASGHLPGAINLPVRPTPTAELTDRISRLPRKPIVAACYDRRSCFNAEVLGLELTRAGHDFRGRYTLPWEYFIPKKPKPHIEAWMAASQAGLWQKSIDVVGGLLDSAAGRIGLLLTILLAAVASRLAVLPVAIKAERDQIRANAAAPELAELKDRLKHDPQRLTRAIKAFYTRHGLTPLRNLLALAFLPVMMIMLSAVQIAANGNNVSLLWIDDIAAPDPLYVLPAIFALLGSVYLDLVLVRTKRQRVLAWLIALPVLTGLAAILSAAASLYLIVSAVLLLVQRAAVTGQFSRLARLPDALREARRNLQARTGIIPLTDAEQLAGCGNKAYRLARLRQHGIAVPDGVVLTTSFLQRLQAADGSARQQMLDRAWQMLGADRVAVRSSAAAEDGATQSFAGVFESVLDVEYESLERAIDEVMASFVSGRAGSYGLDASGGNILVQRMISPEFAGVLFTRDPESAGAMMVEMVRGTADDLVSGMAAPDTFRFGRHSHESLDETGAPFDIASLLATGAQAEEIFGGPQDIEWTYRDGAFMIVQSRDITALLGTAAQDQLALDEWNKVFALAADAGADEIVLEQTEMSEVLPRPTPLSLSLMSSLWAPGGSVDLSCRSLGLTYPVEEDAPSHLQTVFGRLYTDPRRMKQNAVTLTKAASVRLTKGVESIERRFREEFLPLFNAEMNVLEIANFEKMATPELFACVERLREEFVTSTHVEVETVNIAADFHTARAKLAIENTGLDPAALLGSAADAVSARALSEALALPAAEKKLHLVAKFGHRAGFDYELSEPRYSETPEHLDALCGLEFSHAAEAADSGPELPEDVKTSVGIARRYQVLKEDAKHESLRHLAVLRHALMELDRRLNLSGLCFYLTFEELAELQARGAAALRPVASRRQEEQQKLLAMPALPTSLTLKQLESASLVSAAQGADAISDLQGTRVSGSSAVSGRCCVVSMEAAEAGKPIEGFRDGDIIVCSMVHPAWLPFVLRSGGVVSEVGGWLSHMAIVAREHDIAMIVGARGVHAIADQSRLRLHPSGEIELLDLQLQDGASEPVRV